MGFKGRNPASGGSHRVVGLATRSVGPLGSALCFLPWAGCVLPSMARLPSHVQVGAPVLSPAGFAGIPGRQAVGPPSFRSVLVSGPGDRLAP